VHWPCFLSSFVTSHLENCFRAWSECFCVYFYYFLGCIHFRISIFSLCLYLQLNQKKFHPNANLRSVATGSWGCGSQAGDAQFKVIIQWLAASVTNVPILIYYTCSNKNLSKLDTVVRVLHGEFAINFVGKGWTREILNFYSFFIKIQNLNWE
jgi:hypothetical protein